MIVKRKLFSDSNNSNNNELMISAGGVGATIPLVNSGIKDLKKNKRKVIGLEEMFHNTDSPDAVLKEGIKAKFSEDPNNLTNTVLDDVSMKEKKGKVYLGRKKEVSDIVGLSRKQKTGRDGKTLHVNIPYEDLKKMKQVDNPELHGAKTFEEYLPHVKKLAKNKLKKEYGSLLNESELDKLVNNDDFTNQMRQNYEFVGKKGTKVIEGDIDSKYIKESKNYKKYGLKDWGKYIKNNPKRFLKASAKGGAKIIAGAGLLSGSTLLAMKAAKNKNKNK